MSKRSKIVRVPRRTTYVIRNGELVEKHLAPPLHAPRTAPNVISDHMAPTKHMATGKVTDSKSAFRAMTRTAGCVEVGTDPAGRRPPPPRELPSMAPYVERAIAQLETR